MNISVEALQAPTKDSLDAWLNTPRLAKCGEVFTPAEPMWSPDKSTNQPVNWEAAIACVSSDWQPWLQAALAYRMANAAARTVANTANVLSRAAQSGLDPLNEGHWSLCGSDLTIESLVSLQLSWRFGTTANHSNSTRRNN